MKNNNAGMIDDSTRMINQDTGMITDSTGMTENPAGMTNENTEMIMNVDNSEFTKTGRRKRSRKEASTANRKTFLYIH